LTPAGKRLARRLERDHRTYQHRLLNGITAEQQQTVLDVLRRIGTNITTAKAHP
jgi:MarR family transcriptional regulator for hemolysin